MWKVILIVCCFVVEALFAQQPTYTLDDCIAIALKQNLDYQQSDYNKQRSKINFKQSWGNMLPSLNGYYDIAASSGRSIDPFTNAYSNQELTYSNASLSLGVTVFNGFKLLNTLKQRKLELEASELEREGARQTLKLNVALAFLNVLNAKAIAEQMHLNLEATQKQYERIEKRNEEGESSPSDYADIKGQLSKEQLAVAKAENAKKQAHLNLEVLLNTDESFSVNETMSETLQLYRIPFDEVCNSALQQFPSLQAKQKRIEASKKSLSITRSNYSPNVSLFAQAGSNYSSAGRTFTVTGEHTIATGKFVTIDNEQFDVMETKNTFREQKIAYQTQFKNNLNTVIGLQVQIPVFNRFKTRSQVALEKIKVSELLLELQQTQQQLKQAIKQAYLEMEITYFRYESLKKQVDAYKESFRVHALQYDNGVANFLAYITSKNNLSSSQIQFVNAKYDYLLRCKVLDFYREIAKI